MKRKLEMTVMAALVLAAANIIGFASVSVAQPAKDLSGVPTDISAQAKKQGKGQAAQRGSSPRSAAPRGGGGGGGGGDGDGDGDGGQRNVGQRNTVQRSAAPRNTIPRSNVQRSAVQRNTVRSTTPRNTIQRGSVQRNTVRSTTQGNTIQRGAVQRNTVRSTTQRNTIQRGAVQRNAIQTGGALRSVSIRGASSATIAGRNYSIRRDGYRVRRGGDWRTFVGLSTLSAIMLGTSYYYPYAYIEAPVPYCEGLTEDGCQLQWQAVPTVEGPTEFQCVAYCPWQ